LVRIGAAAGFDMNAASPEEPIPQDADAVIVATHGKGEEAVLDAALRAGVPYVALVASRRRGDAVLASLGTDRQRVHTPAGLDIGARTASEVALSILAEFIEQSRGAAPVPEAAAVPEEAEKEPTAIDPVCGMTVVISPTAIRAEHAGHTFYFCASGCKVDFLNDPHRYLTDE